MTTRKQADVGMPGLDPAMFGNQNLEMMSQIYAPFLSAQITMLNWQAANVKRVGQAYAQWFEFLGHRLEADASFAAQLQTAKNAEQVGKTCSKFMEEAAKDYNEEVSELTKLSGTLANEATDALQDFSAGPKVGAVLGE